jgi:hypothetical protein
MVTSRLSQAVDADDADDGFLVTKGRGPPNDRREEAAAESADTTPEFIMAATANSTVVDREGDLMLAVVVVVKDVCWLYVVACIMSFDSWRYPMAISAFVTASAKELMRKGGQVIDDEQRRLDPYAMTWSSDGATFLPTTDESWRISSSEIACRLVLND